MSKKFSKLVLFSAIAGAVAAGTYYYLQKKNDAPSKDMDDIDDFDDFDEDWDDDDIDDIPSSASKGRSYVALDLDNAKEIIGEKVIETLDKTKEKIIEFNVPEKLEKAKEFVEELAYTELHAKDSSMSETYTTVSGVAPSDNSSTYQAPAEDAMETEEFFDDTEE